MSGAHLFEDAEHWRRRAAEMRALAADVVDPIVKEKLLQAALDYERLAQRAEKRRAGGDDPV